jgi:hypothetical protein
VLLADVAAFLLHSGFTVPDEMRVIASRDGGATPAVTAPAPASSADESPPERRDRLGKRVGALKARGVKDFSKQVAKEEKISTSRLRQILKPPKAIPLSPDPADPFGLKKKR